MVHGFGHEPKSADLLIIANEKQVDGVDVYQRLACLERCGSGHH